MEDIIVERGKKRRRRSKKPKVQRTYTFSDILHETMDEVENSYSMLVYSHPTNLSPEQIIFALEFMKNGYKAIPAIHDTFGGLASDWCNKKCLAMAKRLLSLDKVKKFINEELELRAEKLKVTSDWIAMKYKTWATINVTDFLEVRYRELPGGEKGRPYIHLKVELEDLPTEIKSAIKSVSISAQGDLKVDFVDPKGALDSLSKLMGMHEDTLNIKTKGPVILQFDEQDADA